MQPKLRQCLKAGLIGGFLASFLNHVWNYVGTHYLSTQGVPGPWLMIVSLTSFLPLLFSGGVYYLLITHDPRGSRHYQLLFGFLTIVGVGLAFRNELINGNPAPAHFAMLSAPMHAITGLTAIFGIPYLSRS